MELNKEYKVSDYPLEELEPGTIIKGLRYSHTENVIQDIVIISEGGGRWQDQIIIGFCVNSGEFYTETHSIATYKILKFPK